MIVVTGATGTLGRLVVERLLDQVPGQRLAVSVRDPAKAETWAARGVRVRHGDFAAPATLDAAFEGAEQLFLISSNAAAYGGDALAQHRVAIDAAKRAGIRRIVFTSHMGASATSAFPPMREHAATEAMLAESGLAWTALRHGFYASTIPMLIGDAAGSGKLAAPADGPVSWTTHEDLAAGDAAILLDEGRFEGPTPPLTAGEALDLAGIAAVLSDAAGRPVSRVTILEDDMAGHMASAGVPAAVIDITKGLYRAAAAGEFAAIDATLARLLGHEPTGASVFTRALVNNREAIDAVA